MLDDDDDDDERPEIFGARRVGLFTNRWRCRDGPPIYSHAHIYVIFV